jgi:hypothetical protein
LVAVVQVHHKQLVAVVVAVQVVILLAGLMFQIQSQ